MTKELLNLCDLYTNKVVDVVQGLLSDLDVLDKAPIDGLPKLEDVIEAHSRGSIKALIAFMSLPELEIS